MHVPNEQVAKDADPGSVGGEKHAGRLDKGLDYVDGEPDRRGGIDPGRRQLVQQIIREEPASTTFMTARAAPERSKAVPASTRALVLVSTST